MPKQCIQVWALWTNISWFKSWLCHKPVMWFQVNLSLSFLICQLGTKNTVLVGLGEISKSVWIKRIYPAIWQSLPLTLWGDSKWWVTRQMWLVAVQWTCGGGAGPWLLPSGPPGAAPLLSVAQPTGHLWWDLQGPGESPVKWVPISVLRDDGSSALCTCHCPEWRVKLIHRGLQADPAFFCCAWTSPGLGLGHFVLLEWSAFASKKFQLAYTEIYLWVVLETDLSLYFNSVSYLSSYFHNHIIWSYLVSIISFDIQGNWGMISCCRSPTFWSHAYSVALCHHFWHSAFIISTWRWFSMMS